jgi:hypothetical protein
MNGTLYEKMKHWCELMKHYWVISIRFVRIRRQRSHDLRVAFSTAAMTHRGHSVNPRQLDAARASAKIPTIGHVSMTTPNIS